MYKIEDIGLWAGIKSMVSYFKVTTTREQ